MKRILNYLLASSVCLLMASCAKKLETNVPQESATVKTENSRLTIGQHMGLTNTQRYVKYTGTAGVYSNLNGSFGDNRFRDDITNAVLLNVTGLAADINNAGFILSRPSATSDWRIYKFPLGDCNSCNVTCVLTGTSSRILSDLEYDPLTGRVFLLDRTGLNLVEVNFAGTIVNSGSLAPYNNVDGLGLIPGSSTPFILAQQGTNGYLCKCDNTTCLPGWAFATSLYTPPAVPFGAAVECGTFYDAASSNLFVVGGNTAAQNWTPTLPLGMGGFAPTWIIPSHRLIDMAQY